MARTYPSRVCAYIVGKWFNQVYHLYHLPQRRDTWNRWYTCFLSCAIYIRARGNGWHHRQPVCHLTQSSRHLTQSSRHLTQSSCHCLQSRRQLTDASEAMDSLENWMLKSLPTNLRSLLSADSRLIFANSRLEILKGRCLATSRCRRPYGL